MWIIKSPKRVVTTTNQYRKNEEKTRYIKVFWKTSLDPIFCLQISFANELKGSEYASGHIGERVDSVFQYQNHNSKYEYLKHYFCLFI